MTAAFALTGRQLRRFVRAPDQVVSSVAFPAMVLVVTLATFGDVIEQFTGEDYVRLVVPGIVTMSLAYGSVGSGVAMLEDLRDGFASRLRSMPVPGWSLLAARVMSDAVRAVGSTLALTAVGYAVGFRFGGGLLGAVGFFALAAWGTTAFGWVALTLGTRASSADAIVAPLNALYLTCLFLSEGFVPMQGFPGWVQPFVRVNPFTCIRNALGALAEGGPLASPMLGALAWIVGLTAVFAPLAISGYRRRA